MQKSPGRTTNRKRSRKTMTEKKRKKHESVKQTENE